MKYIRAFENFTTDDDRHGTEYIPSFNPQINLSAKEFVDNNFNAHYLSFAKLVNYQLDHEGSPTPEQEEELKSLVVEYYKKNPEAIGKDIKIQAIPPKIGDGIPRVQNIGGSSFANSRRIGE